MADENLNINVTAEDNASAKLARIRKEANALGGTLNGRTSPALQNLSKRGLGSLTSQGGLATGIMDDLGLGMAGVGAGASAATLGIAAIAAAAIYGAQNMYQLAQETLKVQRATGLSAEEASRMIAVSDDLNVTSEKLGRSMAMLAKNAGSNTDTLAELGISAAQASAGEDQMLGLLMQTADAYQAATTQADKAAIGQAAFGRGYLDMVPLLEQGSGAIAQAFAGVDQKEILSEEQVQRAEELRMAIDNLMDQLNGLARDVGGDLIPILTGLVKLLGLLAKYWGMQIDAIKQFASAIPGVGSALGWLADKLGMVASSSDVMAGKLAAAQDAANQFSQRLAEEAASVEEYEQQVFAMAGSILALTQAQDRQEDSERAVAKAHKLAADAVIDYVQWITKAPAKMREIQRAERGLSDARRGEEQAVKGVARATAALDMIRKGEARTLAEAQYRVLEAEMALEDLNTTISNTSGELSFIVSADEFNRAQRDLQKAAIDRARAEWELEDATAANQQLAAGGIEASDPYIQAQEAIRDAEDQLAASRQGVADATLVVSDAQAKYVEDTALAAEAIVESRETVEDAEWAAISAALGLTTQQDALNDALRDTPGLAQDAIDMLATMAEKVPSAAGAIRDLQEALGAEQTRVDAAEAANAVSAVSLIGQIELDTLRTQFQDALRNPDASAAALNTLSIRILGESENRARNAGYTPEQIQLILSQVHQYLTRGGTTGTVRP